MRTMLTVSSVALLIATFAACKSDKQPTERATPEAPVKTEELAEAAAPTPPKSSSVPGTPKTIRSSLFSSRTPRAVERSAGAVGAGVGTCRLLGKEFR